MKLISIIIPVYNNSETLENLQKRIEEDLVSKIKNYNFEIIYVNDGSKDESFSILKEFVKHQHNIHVINLTKNYGQQYAVLAGWHHAKGDAVIDLAADLQDPPGQCINMIHEWENGNKIVLSFRQENRTSFGRRITSRLFYRIILPNAPKGGFDYTLLDRQPLNQILKFKDKNRFYQADILSLGFSIKAIPYIKEKRVIGKSQYSFLKRIKLFLNTYLNVSYAPLRFFSITGILVTIVGFIYGITVLLGFMFGTFPFRGWTPLMLTMLIIGGLILTSLGILGEYVWRILDEVRGRPNFIIDEIIEKKEDD